MKCAGCNNKAEYWVEVSASEYQEHCLDCMIESLCSEPVKVIHIESLEAANRGKGKTHPQAS